MGSGTFLLGLEYPCSKNELICENEGSCRFIIGIPKCICKDGNFGEYCQLQGNITSYSTGS